MVSNDPSHAIAYPIQHDASIGGERKQATRNVANNAKFKKNFQFKTVCNGDKAYIIQLKQQKSKRCCYFYRQNAPK